MKKQIQIASIVLAFLILCNSVLFPIDFLTPFGVNQTNLAGQIKEKLTGDIAFGISIEQVSGDNVQHKKMDFINVQGTKEEFYFTNPSDALPNGMFFARNIIGDSSKEGHGSHIVQVIPDTSDPTGLTYSVGETVVKNAEDPRLMFFDDGRKGMTFVIRIINDDLLLYSWLFGDKAELYDETGRLISMDDILFNSYFVFINEHGQTIDEKGNIVDLKENEVDENGNPIDEYGRIDPNRYRLGRRGISSKNNYIVKTANGKFALFDRTNGDHPSSIQVYFFDSLEDVLNPPEGYWKRKENSIENATILELDDREPEEKFTIIGFNTLVELDDSFLAFTHRAKTPNSKKLYRGEYVLLDKETLKPKGVPVVWCDPRRYGFDKIGGRVPGVVYANSARKIPKSNILKIKAGINDTFIMAAEGNIDELVEWFWANQPKQDIKADLASDVFAVAAVSKEMAAQTCLQGCN